jgi:high-affinity Fe2+/Pb2+ permease
MNRHGIVTTIAVGGLVAWGSYALLAAPAQAAQKQRTHYAASRAYDGLWSVSIHTAYGPCDATYRYPARIVGGRVLQADSNFSYQISGAVVASGAIGVTVYRGGQSATGYGRLRGSSGSGRWSASGNMCYGTWSAMRRAAN